MENEFGKSTIQDYNEKIAILLERKRKIIKKRRSLSILDEKIGLFMKPLTRIFLLRAQKAMDNEYLAVCREYRDTEELRNAAIFYTKYDCKQSFHIIEAIEKLNKQAQDNKSTGKILLYKQPH